MFAGVLLLSGCAKVRHLDQLLTLKGLADEQVQMNRYVKKQDENFESLVEEIQKGTRNRYSNKRKIRRAFGEPIFVRPVTDGDQELESWLYRYAAEFFGSEKVYLYFDASGSLVKSEYIEEKDGKVAKETETEDGR